MHCICAETHGNHITVLALWELESYMIVNNHMGTGSQDRVLCKSNKVFFPVLELLL